MEPSFFHLENLLHSQAFQPFPRHDETIFGDPASSRQLTTSPGLAKDPKRSPKSCLFLAEKHGDDPNHLVFWDDIPSYKL